ncbi:MAG: CbrC family protein [Opitutaceae bacterium]|nr:CbrC family protein [Opitutaceae bacterium]
MPTDSLPAFRFHPDPIRSGSVANSPARCRRCRRAPGFIYTGPVYAERDLANQLCPWCIADGSAYQKFGATFVDTEAFSDEVPAELVDEVVQRTPGFATWQAERWLSAEGVPAEFVEPAGIQDIRARYRYVEGPLMGFIVHELGISGGAAVRLLESLRRETSPTAFIFYDRAHDQYRGYVDTL